MNFVPWAKPLSRLRSPDSYQSRSNTQAQYQALLDPAWQTACRLSAFPANSLLPVTSSIWSKVLHVPSVLASMLHPHDQRLASSWRTGRRTVSNQRARDLPVSPSLGSRAYRLPLRQGIYLDCASSWQDCSDLSLLPWIFLTQFLRFCHSQPKLLLGIRGFPLRHQILSRQVVTFPHVDILRRACGLRLLNLRFGQSLVFNTWQEPAMLDIGQKSLI